MKRIYRLFLIAITAFCAFSCGTERKAKHVILFGLDGMASAYFNVDEHPTMFYLLDEQRSGSEIGCVSEWLTIKCLIGSMSEDYYDRPSNACLQIASVD